MSYLKALTLDGVSHLIGEPEKIEGELKDLNQQMEDLAFSNFRIFLHSSETTSNVRSDMSRIKNHCEGIEGSAPNFTSLCQEFCKNTQAMSKTRRLNSKTLKQHPAILELLEIPQVMDTCIKNQHYDEALEIEKFVNRLEKQLADVRIIKDIANEVRSAISQMVNQLHQNLSQDIDLPTCIRAIGYLKRLSTYNSLELKVVFLQCRGSYKEHLISSIFSTNTFNHLTKMIDIYRVQLMEITTQYNAIFVDSEELSDHVQSNDSVLNSWLAFQVQTFLGFLKTKIGEVHDPSNMDILKNQCNYFGKSLARIGADFRAMLPLIFEV